MITAREISEKLSARVEEVLNLLLPGGKKLGNEWCVGDVDGSEGKSLRVHLTGEKSGVWCDFATGQSGDLLDLWALVKSVPLSDAINQAKNFLGVREPEWTGYQRRTFKKPEKPKCQKPQGDIFKYLTEERKLNNESLEVYKISEKSSKIIFPYLRNNELLQVKYLNLDREGGRKLISVEKDCEPCLFGWQAIPQNSREITICEGEIDAVSLYQLGKPAVSVPFGGGGGQKQQWIEYEFDNLAQFDTIYLCLDQDKEGQLATNEIASRLGRHRCRVVSLPEVKDANEFLQKGFTKKDLEICFSHAKTLDPVELKQASEFLDEVVKEFYPTNESQNGFSPPWSKASQKIKFRPGELSIWTGINGHGKSMILNQIILEALDHGERACVASLEIKPRRLLYRMVRQATTVDLPVVDLIQKTHLWFREKLWIFDALGDVKGDTILEVFRYARQRYGISQFVIDSLMKCGLGEDDYNGQKFFVSKLSDFKNEFNVHVHLVAHARKGESEEKAPGKLDVKGTGTITDLADNDFTIWRNKKKEDLIRCAEEEMVEVELKIKNQIDALLICDKQRNGDWEGKFGLYWHQQSYQYLENQFSRPKVYVE